MEFGSGSSTKSRILLSAMKPAAYVPIDISKDALWDAAAKLSEEFGELPIHPVEGDFTETLRLPPAVGSMPRLGFFPGSTIGNLLASDAVDLLRTMARTLGRGSMLLIGIDRIKDPEILLPAYDDAQGVTAAFNLNLLHRINRELQWHDAGRRSFVTSRSGTMPRRASRCISRQQRDVQFRSMVGLSQSPRAIPSIRKTASNTVRGTPFCCCAPAAGTRSQTGRTRKNSFR